MDIEKLIEQMTLEEKASLLSGGDFWHTKAVERLGIPATMVSDGPHGLRKQDQEGDHLGINESIKAVCFPAASASAASFDRATELLVNLPEEQYVALLAKLAAGASVTGDEEIVLNARDRAAVGEKVVAAANAKLSGGKLRLSDKTGDFKGGLILHRGSIEANCTAELLVDLRREDMASELAGVLFG